jgi:hypothetical protein
MISLEKNLKINIKRIKKQETYNPIELWLMTENPVTRLDGSRTRQILYSYNGGTHQNFQKCRLDFSN